MTSGEQQGRKRAAARVQDEEAEILQKQMGRPPKRQRFDDNAVDIQDQQHQQMHSEWNHDVDLGLYDSNGEHCSVSDGGNGVQATRNSIADWPAIPQGVTPTLTSDPARESPPRHCPPPAEQALRVDGHGNAHTQTRDPSMLLLLDPSLPSTSPEWPPSALPSCACLSTMYITLNTLQAMEPYFSFPFALYPLGEAMQTASKVLTCDQCPTKFMTALHNCQLVGTLLVSIAEHYSKVLESINSEAVRADAGSETKKYRVSDLNASTSQLHTGGIGCAAAFHIDLSPAEWRAMTKKVVRSEVYGTVDGSSCCPYLLGLIQDMRDRQNKWHQPDFALPSDFPKDANGIRMGGNRIPDENHV